MVAHEAGFQSIDDEYSGLELEVAGSLPPWLEGTLLRNGPGQFETATDSVDHWFDGLALLRAFQFEAGEVRFTARFLRSEAFETVRSTGQFPTGGFAASGGWLQELKGLIAPRPSDNANVSVARYADRYVALTEAPRAVAFEPDTLRTRGRFTFEDDLAPHLVSAHPVHDPYEEATFNLSLRFGRSHRYSLHRLPDDRAERELITTIEVEQPAYVHSFGLTRNHIVIMEFPLVIDLRKLLSPSGGFFVDSFTWQPERGTHCRMIDRSDGTVRVDLTAPTAFGFHHVNAYETDGHAVVDLVTFDGPDVIEQLYLDRLQNGVPDLGGELQRYRVPMDGGTDELVPETLYQGITLPTFDRRRTGRSYRYAYGQGRGTAADHRLVAVNVETRSATEFVKADAYFGEPVYVGKPDGDPGEGVVLSVGLDATTGQSFLLVLDASTMTERARAPLPTGLPFDFHGHFYPGL